MEAQQCFTRNMSVFTSHCSCDVRGHGWTAVVMEEAHQQCLIVSIYLRNSVGLEEETNARVLGELMACIQQWSGPTPEWHAQVKLCLFTWVYLISLFDPISLFVCCSAKRLPADFQRLQIGRCSPRLLFVRTRSHNFWRNMRSESEFLGTQRSLSIFALFLFYDILIYFIVVLHASQCSFWG